ncbi:hypothetical protein [Aegicerativicinus sediminis]|uniref:hypothetical protein n=1 Tax=Aegicerativicinus sediminis TaxID=2893202 RepID=UPI001E5CD06A|nr:hypothetical protein [Aegicerativicinus sediminis]
MKTPYLLLIAGFMALSCKNETKTEEPKAILSTPENEIVVETASISGSYVDDSYSKRGEGFDWVGVRVSNNEDNTLHVSVRSRADQKKPTCTWDAKAEKIDENTYQTWYEGKTILFSFTDNQISIKPENPEDNTTLYFFCSGGATLEGTYTKIEGDLDKDQVDNTIFSKNLKLENIGFYVTSKPEGGSTQVTIMPYGPEMRPDLLTHTIEGEIVDAEVEDLNRDGSPEILLFTKDNIGNNDVIAYSGNNNKSMSMVYLPPITNNAEASKGYNGKDEFALIEASLVRRFPIEGSGKMRQIQYKLVNGENSRIFEIANVSEY